ncbi:MAG: lysophospholipid acyltransferase family protein [Candidatus Korobacteraceae bacterium]
MAGALPTAHYGTHFSRSSSGPCDVACVDCKQAFGARLRQMGQRLARQARRLRRLLFLTVAVFYGLWEHRKLRPHASRAECAQWLNETCARGLRSIDVQLSVEGQRPQRGLIVSNHLSYLDILSYSAAVPCVFISKADVADWPIFGRYATWAGSVFVRRHDRADAARANVSVGESLDSGVPVVLFPEGTTTNGSRVLRFHSTMLQPAVDASAPITPASIRYELEDGDVGQEVCWWGEMTFLPHVWNLLSRKSIRARIIFGESIAAGADRKALSQILHEKVVRLHAGLQHSEINPNLAASLHR